MPIELTVIMLAFAVSIDGFGVGMACGIRKLLILPFSLLIICLFSSGAVALSMFLGMGMASFVTADFAAQGGGLLLLLLGLYFIIQNVYKLLRKKDGVEDTGAPSSKRLVKYSGITRQPERADIDNSGTLSAGESLVLGAALGADAFGAGFGAVLVGLNPVVTIAAVGLAKLLLVPLGVIVGNKIVSVGSFSSYAPIISGLIFITIGLTVFI